MTQYKTFFMFQSLHRHKMCLIYHLSNIEMHYYCIRIHLSPYSILSDVKLKIFRNIDIFQDSSIKLQYIIFPISILSIYILSNLTAHSCIGQWSLQKKINLPLLQIKLDMKKNSNIIILKICS